MEKISSGSAVFDTLLKGGYEKDIITTIYGPAGSGKTCACILAAISVVKSGKKVIYVDTEGGFSAERIKQLTPNYKAIMNKMVFYKPISFREQMKAFEKMKNYVKQNIGLIIIDTIAYLYRLEIGKNKDVYKVNSELGRQISYLTEIARRKNIPVMITNQVYANFDERDKVNMVGGDILKYGSKCLIEFQITPDSKRRAVLKKHRSLKEELSLGFEIKEEGIIKIKKPKFRIF